MKKKNYQAMTNAEFKKFTKTATAQELIKAFCKGKTRPQIERDIQRAERGK